MKKVDSKLPFACPDLSQLDTTDLYVKDLSLNGFGGLLFGREETGSKSGTLEHWNTCKLQKTTGTNSTQDAGGGSPERRP